MKRSIKQILVLVCCLVICLPISACSEDGKSQTKRITALGALVDITAYGKNAEVGIREAEAALTSVASTPRTIRAGSRSS